MCRPPFKEKSAPVAKADSSEASQATIDAISSGSPRRFTGMESTIAGKDVRLHRPNHLGADVAG